MIRRRLSLPSRERGLKSLSSCPQFEIISVAPLAGAWIEIDPFDDLVMDSNVAPLAGAWIEIQILLFQDCCSWSLPSRERGLKFISSGFCCRSLWSLPSRERGLKFLVDAILIIKIKVAPLAGAWIEISTFTFLVLQNPVAPLAGAWIEIYLTKEIRWRTQPSLPSRERGLKSSGMFIKPFASVVAPLAGAWIEI